ncbi:MAG: flagellar basal body-associated FliL family protein [Gallionella sp.]|nr:flagellar basal body-associated FliL family protein [Gallionella sp.]
MTYWKPIVILISALLLLAVAALLYLPQMNHKTPAHLNAGDNPDTSEVSSDEKPEFVHLGEFLINLNGEDRPQFLKTSISLKLGKPGYIESIEASIPEIRHHVNMLLQTLTATELSTHEGKQLLAKQIKEHTEHVMGYRKATETSGMKKSIIADVLFTSFIIQH